MTFESNSQSRVRHQPLDRARQRHRIVKRSSGSTNRMAEAPSKGDGLIKGPATGVTGHFKTAAMVRDP